MDVKTKNRLKAKSLLAFGRTSRWQTIMRKGRWDGRMTHPISLEEIEDTMDYILKERERIQNVREEDDTGTIGSRDEENRGSEETKGNEDSGDKA